MFLFKKAWPYLVIFVIVLAFFAPIFKGQVPFPGDYLVNENPYNSVSVLGYSLGGYPSKGQGIDVAKEIYPWRFFSIGELKSGEIPFWNPHNFSGNPQLANFQTAIFYPLNFLYFLFPFNLSWTLVIMLQPLLAASFLFIFLNKGLKLSKEASVLGGLTFGFSSYMTVWMEYANIGHTFLWLPIILYFVKRLVEKNTGFNFIILTLLYAFSLLGGYIQGFFYITVFSFLYFLFEALKTDKGKVKSFVFFFLTIFISVLLSSFQLLLTYEIFTQSTRGSYSLSHISDLLLPPYYLITFFISDFFGNPATRNYWIDGTYIERVMYIGVGLSLFIFYAAFKVKTREKLFFLIITIFSLLIAVNFPLVKYLYLLPIPFVSTTIPTRELSVFIFGGIVLASMGIDYWQKNNHKSKLPIYFLLFYVLVIIGEFISYYLGIFPKDNFTISIRNSILPLTLAFATVFVFYFKKYNLKIALTLLLLIILLDLSYFFNKITPFSPQETIYPQTPVVSFIKENQGIDRYWTYGGAYIYSNFQTVDKTYSPEGNDPLHIKRYGELVASSKEGEIPEELPRPDANIAAGFSKEDLRNNLFRKRILDLLGIKYVLNVSSEQRADLDTFKEDSYKLLWQKDKWQVYENIKALPRFFTASKFIVETDKNKILNLIYDQDLNLRETVLLEQKPVLQIDEKATGEARLISYLPNRVEIEADTTGNQLLFLSDNYYPGWKAYVDNVETKIQRANYSFRAVAVPTGKHNIVFLYSPPYFWLGLKVAVFGILLILIGVFYLKYEKKS